MSRVQVPSRAPLFELIVIRKFSVKLNNLSKKASLIFLIYLSISVIITPSLNTNKINEDLSYAGYNLLVTPELDKSAQEIYEVYHGLWRIEESFRIMKTYLEARPVYLQKEESIYGHFLICYLSLVVLRLLELKVFNDELSSSELISFIREYNVTETPEKNYINNAIRSETYLKIKSTLGLSKLGNLYLTKKNLDNLLNDVDLNT